MPLLAFTFANPLLLWGLALAGIPVIIHLLHKRRYREVPWAAMRFLAAAVRKNSRRLRIEQLLLLALRVLILVLVALALAQPYLQSFGVSYRAGDPTHRIIVVDASLSMQYEPGDASRFEKAQELARQIAQDAQQGDVLNLVRIAGTEPRAVVREPAYQSSPVLDEIERLQPTEERGDPLPSLQQVAELLGQAAEVGRKEVYLISDFQRDAWLPDSGAANPQIRQLLRQLAERAELFFVDVAPADSPNVAVTSFTADEPFITAGRPVSLQATVRNYDDAPAPQQTVELYVEGRLAGTARVDLPADGQAQAAWTHTFRGSGDHRLEARLAPDALAADDRRFLSLPVKDELNVLLINGRSAGRPEENATFYLERAFAPATERQPWQGFTQPTVMTEGDLAGTDLSRFDCVFVSNVGLMTDREAEILRAYLDGGGGVVFCLGDQVKTDNYNRVLYRDGEGILPARLGRRVGNAAAPQRSFEFDAERLEHPIVSPFRGNLGTGLESDFTLEYVQAEPAADSQALVVLRYMSGDPAIIDAPVGRGRVVLITTAVDNRWGPWPVQRSFLPIVQETARYLASGQWSERQRLVGEPLVHVLPTQRTGLAATLERPDGTRENVPLRDESGAVSLHVEDTRTSGLYALKLGPPLGRTEHFAVNVDTRESNLAQLDEPELKAELLPDVEFGYLTDWQPSVRVGAVSASGGADLIRLLLLAAFGLLFAEQLMAWRFLPGVLLLAAIVAAGLVYLGFAVGPAVGLLLACLMAAALAAAIRSVRRGGAATR